jgi:hypothetical protein
VGWVPWMIAALVVAGVVAALVYGHQREKRRTQGLHEVAESLGFQFQPGKDVEVLGRLDQFGLFSSGRSRSVWNVMRGDAETERLALFDYRYTVGSGKNQRTYRQTMVVFESEQLNLPHFELRPESWWDKFTALIGWNDIDFNEYPEFSKRYHLSSKDADVRRAFTEPVIRHFESMQRAYVAGRGTCLVFCFANRRIPPLDLKSFLQQAYGVYAVLKEPSEPSRDTES